MAKQRFRTFAAVGLLTVTLGGSAYAGDGALSTPLSGKWILSDKETALDGHLCTSSAMLWGDHVTLKVPPGATAFEGRAGLTSRGGHTALTVKADGQERENLALHYGKSEAVRIPLKDVKTITFAVPQPYPAVTVCNPTFIR